MERWRWMEVDSSWTGLDCWTGLDWSLALGVECGLWSGHAAQPAQVGLGLAVSQSRWRKAGIGFGSGFRVSQRPGQSGREVGALVGGGLGGGNMK